MPIYYSQNGEDAILWNLFYDKSEPGFFVDVGALDGMRFSNTYSFEQEGWRGICVEAHTKYFGLLKKNRPNSICIHAAVSDHDQDEVKFYANSRGSLSTLDPTKEEYFHKHFGKYFTGFEVQRVPMRTLNSILAEVAAPTSIDFVSIDVEGYEMAVLRGFDLAKYRPRVLVMEAIFEEERIEMDKYMHEAGYLKVRVLGPNIFYCRDEQDIPKIATASRRVPLCHTQHPLNVDKSKREPVLYQLKHKMIHQLKKILPYSKLSRQGKRAISPMYDVGFHGDKYLLSLVDSIMQVVKVFVETGTNVGSTLTYVARTYPHILCLSCEPDLQAFNQAVKNTANLPNVSIYNETSQEFLKHLSQQYTYLFGKNILFWLDAHGYGFKWPLKEEVAFITTNFKASYILIDDFKVLGLDCFGYDEYEEQICSFDYIKDVLNPELKYNLYYPSYTERTSKHHPLRGWILIEFGNNNELELPKFLRDKVRRLRYGDGLRKV